MKYDKTVSWFLRSNELKNSKSYEKKLNLILTNATKTFIILFVLKNKQVKHGEIAQLARATGSYPVGREFESPSRYQEQQALQGLLIF